MADAFLTSDLDLDIRAALQRVDRLNEALNRATTGIVVTADVRQVTAAIDAAVEAADALLTIAADTSQVPGEITAAVDAADSQVVVTGDASEVTGSIDGAVDAADTAVEVTGQAAQVTGAIDAAVQNANTSVSVEGQVSPGLRQGVDSLGDGLDAAATSGIGLKGILAGLSVAAVVAGFKALAAAGSDLQESTSKAATVFGDEFADIEAFATGAAQSVGLSEQAALEATGTFGNLFQALGTSREEAAKLSPEVVQLAGDLASFNNLGVDEALEKLRSGLVGEIEPLRSLGVSFLAADVTAKALELGLGGVNGELTEGEKVQARYALIVEQTSLAAGDYARTSEGLANQQRTLSAEIDNAAAAAGTLLLPAFLAIVDASRDAIPGLSQLGEDVLPSVADALANLAPLIGTSVDLLILLSPIITVLATALAAIPPEAIALGGSMLIAVKAFGLLSKAGGLLSTGIPKIAKSLLGLNPLVIGAAVGAGLLFKEWQEGKDRAADVAVVVDAMSDSFAGVGTDVTSARAAIEGFLTDLVAAGDKIQSTSELIDEKLTASDVFTDLGLSASTAADLIAGGVGAVDEFGASLGDLDLSGKASLVLLRGLAEQAGEAAKANLLARDATDLLTDAESRELDALIARNAPTAEFVELLDRASAAAARQAAETERLIAKYAPLTAIYLDTGDALASLTESSPAAALAIAAVANQGADPTAESLLGLASVLDEAKLSEEQMAAAALALGTDIGTLQVFIEDSTGALQTFIDAAVGGLPAISAAFQDTSGDSAVSAREFINGLLLETTRMSQFIADLAVIVEEGFVEVAGVLSAQGVEAAAVAASELANAAREGNNALLLETQAGLDQRDAAIAFSTEYLTETLGPEYIAATGQVGTLSSEILGATFTPEEQTRIKMELAALTLDENGKQLAAIAALVGTAEAREYGKALNLDEKTIDEAVKAGAAITANAPVAAASTAGVSVGEAFANGVFEGISNRAGAAADKAAQLVVQAKHAADVAAGNRSPSRLFAEVGRDLGLGLVVGLEAEAGAVAAATGGLMQAVIEASRSAAIPDITLGVSIDQAAAGAAIADAEQIVRDAMGEVSVLPLRVEGVVVDPIGLTASASQSAAGAGGLSIGQITIPVTIPLGMTREQGVEVGEGIADGMERRLVERRLSVLSRAT